MDHRDYWTLVAPAVEVRRADDPGQGVHHDDVEASRVQSRPESGCRCLLLPRLRLQSLFSHRVPFEEAPRAYRLVDEGPDEAVQVVLIHDQG